jgi:hypothetical protein
MKFPQNIILLFVLFFVNTCATYKVQYNKENHQSFPNKDIEHSFYLIGDAGNSPIGTSSKALEAFKEALSIAPKESTAIFLGDNIYPSGLPKKEDEDRPFAEHQLNVQTQAVKNFKGKTIFIPGNHDWYSDGLKGLKRQEDYIEDILGENTFYRKMAAPLKL